MRWVFLYDSKFTRDLSSSLTHQLALLYRIWSEEDEASHCVMNDN